MKTAVIVAGAGAMGFYEVGAMRAYWNLKSLLKIDYEVIAGVSSGGLNSAMAHAGQIDQLYELWLTIRNRDVYRENVLDAFGKKGCLCDNWPLKNLIIQNVDIKALQKNPIPLTVNVANLVTSQLERINLNEVTEAEAFAALLQTAAIPVLFPQVNGRVDGGVLADFPIAEILLDDVDRIIVFSGLAPSKVQLRNLIEVASAAINTMLLSSLVNGLQAVAAMNVIRRLAGKPPIELIMIQPTRDYGIGLIDFDGLGSRANRIALMKEAYDQTDSILKAL